MFDVDSKARSPQKLLDVSRPSSDTFFFSVWFGTSPSLPYQRSNNATLKNIKVESPSSFSLFSSHLSALSLVSHRNFIDISAPPTTPVRQYLMKIAGGGRSTWTRRRRAEMLNWAAQQRWAISGYLSLSVSYKTSALRPTTTIFVDVFLSYTSSLPLCLLSILHILLSGQRCQQWHEAAMSQKN